MRSIWVLNLALATISVAQKYRVDDNPACAIPCIIAASKVANCSVIDESCVCPSQKLQEVVEGCTLGSCTFKDALATKNITWTACGYPNNDEYPKTIPARITLFVLLPTLSFVLRMAVKKAGLSVWGADDTTIVVAYVFILGMTASDYIWASFGAGRNLWTLPERNVTKTFQMLFACQIQYFITLTAIRASILFMYLRIFPSRTFRIVLWATHAFNALVWIAFLLIIVFRCIPVNLSWNFWNGGGSDHCLPIDKLGTVQGVVFIALDVWLLILPATQVWRLNMKKSRKFGVTLMFGMGIFTTAIGIVRLKSISEATKYPLNPTVTSVMTGLWSCLECYVAVFTACAPNTWKFIKHFILRRRETTRNSGFQENRQEMMAAGPKTPSQAPTEAADDSCLRESQEQLDS